MWYISYIIMFYCFFYAVWKLAERRNDSKKTAICLMFLIGFSYVLIGSCLVSVGSQWYTSTGALFSGVVVAVHCNQNTDWDKLIFFKCGILGVLLICFTVASQRFEEALVLKDLFTILVGVVFVLFIFTSFLLFQDAIIRSLQQNVFLKCVQYMGRISLWLYIVHMKVAVVLERANSLNIITMLGVTIIVSVIVSYIWLKIEKMFFLIH